MINKKELLFCVNDSNIPTKPLPRDFVHKNRIWHRTSHIWVVNSNNQILCQRRSLIKDMNPGKWECFFGGHLAPQQDYMDGAVNELHEELGIKVLANSIKFLLVNKSNKDKEFQGVYYIVWNGVIKDLKIEKEEIDQVKWIDTNRLKKLILKDKNINWTTFGYEEKMLLHLEKLVNDNII